MSRRAQNSCVRSVAMGSPVSFYCQRTVYHNLKKLRIAGAFAGGICAEILRPIFCAGGSGTTSARFRLCNCFYRQAGRALDADDPHALTTVVKQMIKRQIFNLLSFKFISLSACESDPIDKVRSLYQPPISLSR